MTSVIKFFIAFAPLVYIVLGVGCFFGIRGVIRAYRKKKDAVFGLELEISIEHIRISIAGLMLIVFLIIGEFILQVFLGPTLPANDVVVTQTLDVMSVPTSTLDGTMITSSDEMATISQKKCTPGQIFITFPSDGMVVAGDVVINGTADVPNFGFYKYEFSPSGSGIWTTILAGREIVRDDELGHWDTSHLPSGDYFLQLIVVDNQGNALPGCVVTIRVSGQ